MSEKGSVKMAPCPECDGTVALSRNVKPGEYIECPECGTMLEVISVKPLELDYVLEDWEEWEEEWEEEDV